MNEIFQRFAQEIDRLGGASAVAVRLGVAKGTIYNWREKNNIPLDKLAELQAIGLDTGFVFAATAHATPVQNIELDSDFATVPRYAVTASAGFGKLNSHEDVIGSLCFSRKWLTKRGLAAKDLALIAVAGKSMEPALWSGDLVLINMADTQLRSGRAYALRQGDELLVKYCQLMPGNLLRVSSANADFPPYDIDLAKSADELQVVGAVESSMHEW